MTGPSSGFLSNVHESGFVTVIDTCEADCDSLVTIAGEELHDPAMSNLLDTSPLDLNSS